MARIFRLSCTTTFVLLAMHGRTNAVALGPGHALLFKDQAVVLRNFRGFGTAAMTFEAWLSTSDFCLPGTIMSYTTQPQSSDPEQLSAGVKRFETSYPHHLLACPSSHVSNIWTYSSSCYSVYRNRPAVNILERDSSWHHIAVTAAPDGTIKTYKDGLLMTEVIDNSTEPWQAGGALMLGGRQGCYGGCRDQTFTGFMDEVRIWNVVRSQQEIIDHMRRVDGIAGQPGLAALYSFDDPNMTENMTEAHMWTALDSSGNGNHLPLVTPPQPAPVTIRQGGRSYQTGKLSFHNNYALNEEIGGMPDRDFTVEMWVRTPEYKESASPLENELFMNMYSYATHAVRDSSGTASSGDLVEHVFVDDAILIGKQYIFDYMPEGAFVMNSTVLVSVNSNSKDMMGHVMLFPVDWKDSDWHHVTATWSFVTGKTEIFFDGLPQVPAYKWSDNHSETKFAKDGGVDPHMAAQTLRFGNGSLALGQNQDCYGGCFDSFSLDGDLADVRIWDQVLSQDQIVADMFSASLNDSNGLVARYDFQDENTKKGLPGPNGIARRMVVDSAQGSPEKALYLWSDAPRFEISTAPLADKDGQAVQLPDSFHGDHVLFLSDQQVLLVSNFSNFPETQVTVEFWMRSVDSCNAGVPFSYATGDYESGDDNSFLIANYNNWDVSVMGDMGNQPDRKAGFGSTDGQWHHIAVTWESSTGIATLYLDGRKAWSTVRAQGMRMPSGGTLVVGREQDCMGGCFDSAPGAAGDVQQRYQLEYGAQDFTGEIDELRIWNKVRTESEIKQGMASDLQRAEPSSEASDRISPSEADLVAYWTFEEGSGYLVKDVTANKHDLHIQQPPHWRVVGPQQVCGNGIVEGLEQCDDGDTTAGDGCSATCQVEEGYECTGLQPSTCWRANAHITSATTDGKNNRKSHKVALTIAGSVTAGLLVTAVAFYAASNIMSGAWDTTSLPRLPNLRPVSWSLPSLAWPCKPTEDGYTDLPMVETDLYGSAESGHSPLSEPPLVTYVPPHNPPPLEDPQNFPSG